MQNIHRHCVDANAVVLLERFHRLPVHVGRESDRSERPSVRASHPDQSQIMSRCWHVVADYDCARIMYVMAPIYQPICGYE